MATIANLVLNNGAATPVAKTFTPVGVSGGIAKWQDVSSGIMVSFPTITASMRLPTKQANSTKVTLKLVIPSTEILAPSTLPTKSFDYFANIELVMPYQVTAAQRADLAAFTSNLLASAPVQSMIKDLIGVWG